MFKQSLKEIVNRNGTAQLFQSYPMGFLEEEKGDFYSLLNKTVRNLHTMLGKAPDDIIDSQDLSDVTMFLTNILWDIGHDEEKQKQLLVYQRLKQKKKMKYSKEEELYLRLFEAYIYDSDKKYAFKNVMDLNCEIKKSDLSPEFKKHFESIVSERTKIFFNNEEWSVINNATPQGVKLV